LPLRPLSVHPAESRLLDPGRVRRAAHPAGGQSLGAARPPHAGARGEGGRRRGETERRPAEWQPPDPRARPGAGGADPAARAANRVRTEPAFGLDRYRRLGRLGNLPQRDVGPMLTALELAVADASIGRLARGRKVAPAADEADHS